MLLSEIGDKEIVDIVNGSMHGKLWDAEMLFDEKTGAIKSLIVPDPGGIDQDELPVFVLHHAVGRVPGGPRNIAHD